MAATQLGRSEVILEKDVWVCWTLEQVFSIPGLHLAFKGGTSLSKAYGVISRFSEDLDLVLHCPNLEELENLTRNQRDALTQSLRNSVAEVVRDRVFPELENAFARDFSRKAKLEIQGDHGEQLRLFYASQNTGGYVGESVLLEFGGRNSAEPSLDLELRADLEAVLPQYRFPRPKVHTLSILRTYWEKVTLIHAEVCRTARSSYSRYSRHL